MVSQGQGGVADSVTGQGGVADGVKGKSEEGYQLETQGG